MARFSNVNNVFSNLGAAWFAVEGVFLSAGWSVVASSDGSTYNASGDQITSAGTGAGGRDNNLSWRRMRDPANRRELLIQRSATTLGGTHGRIKMSESARFTGGSPSATQVPSATDEQIFLGGGTDAAPTFVSIFPGSSFRLHMVAESTPVGGVYAFNLFNTSTGSASQAQGVFFCEPMAPGSYRPSDASPCVWYCASTIFTGTCSGWFAYGTGSQFWSTAIGLNAGPYNGTLGVNLVDGADDNGYPTYSATVSGSVRIKGVGSALAVKGPARTYPATANTATDAKCYLGTYAWPYPNNTVPSVS